MEKYILAGVKKKVVIRGAGSHLSIRDGVKHSLVVTLTHL
jgi:hypothetical protein